MLVYRVVPGYWGTRLTSGYIATPPEDAFYDLGYLNMNNGCPYFNMGSGLDAVNSFDYVEEDCKYFYLFPWDALLNSKYIGNVLLIGINTLALLVWKNINKPITNKLKNIIIFFFI